MISGLSRMIPATLGWHRLPAPLGLALRNVLRQRSRSAIALSAIALGVAAMVIAGGFIQDVYVQFAESIIHSQYGHLQIYKKGYSARGTQHPMEYLIADSAAVTRQAQGLAGVETVLARLRFAGLANAGGGDWPIIGEGVEAKLENQLGTYIQVVEGRLLDEKDRYAVMIGDGVAKALHIGPGKALSVNVATREGALNSLEFKVVGVFRSYSKEYGQRAVRLPLKAAQELLGTRGVNEVVVALSSTAATEAAAALVRASFGDANFEVKTWRELADFYNKTVQLFDRQYGFLQMVLLLMIVMSVGNSINTTAFERMPEFGTMMALGDRRRDVFRLIVLECIVLGVLGGIAGCVIGMLLALAISAWGIPMPPPPNTDLGYTALIRIVPGVVAGAFAVGAVSAVFAGLLPALKIARTAPVEALRRSL